MILPRVEIGNDSIVNDINKCIEKIEDEFTSLHIKIDGMIKYHGDLEQRINSLEGK